MQFTRIKKMLLICLMTSLFACSSSPKITVKEFIKNYGTDAFTDFYEPSYYFGDKDASVLSEMKNAVLYYEGYERPLDSYTYSCRETIPSLNAERDITVSVYKEDIFTAEYFGNESEGMEHYTEDGIEFYVEEDTYITFGCLGNCWMRVSYGSLGDDGYYDLNGSSVSIITMEKQLIKDAKDLN